MRINNNYKDKFIKTKTGYYYPLARGLYLSFNEEGVYIGIEMMYLPSQSIEKEAERLLNRLISIDYLEV